MVQVKDVPASGPALGSSNRRSGNWPNPQRLPYLPGLDGVRAIAVVAVLLFHLPARLFPGGYLGVDTFFVLSGFLITTLLLEEVESSGALKFGRFYLRRARRLLPALLVVLAFCAILSLTIARDAASEFRQDAISALTYTTNWWYIFDARSYFDVIGRPPMLQHLWSLAVEEQFYLIWPTVLLLVWRKWKRRGVGIAALVGALASTFWMATLAVHDQIPAATDTARVYFGSDTHGMTIMVGAALAVVWRPARLPRSIPRSAQMSMSVLGLLSIIVMGWFFLSVPEDSTWLYRGGFLVFAVVVGGLVMAASHPAGRFGEALGNPIFRWLGTRSYGIYLWHWPIFLVTRPVVDLPYSGWAAGATSLVLTGLAAEACFRWVEMPIRRGTLAASWHKVRTGDTWARYRWIGIGGATAVTLLVGGVALAQVPTTDPTQYLGGVTSVGAGDLTQKDHDQNQHQHKGPGKDHHQLPANIPLKDRNVTVVGDSVALSARLAVLDLLPNAHFDAIVARQPWETIKRIKEHQDTDHLARLLVIETGTNGIPVADDLHELLLGLKDLDGVVVMNVRSPVPWMNQSNAAIDHAAHGVRNAVVVDWAGISADHGGYFVSDGTHLTVSGANAYARAVKDGLQQAIDQTKEDNDQD